MSKRLTYSEIISLLIGFYKHVKNMEEIKYTNSFIIPRFVADVKLWVFKHLGPKTENPSKKIKDLKRLRRRKHKMLRRDKLWLIAHLKDCCNLLLSLRDNTETLLKFSPITSFERGAYNTMIQKIEEANVPESLERLDLLVKYRATC